MATDDTHWQMDVVAALGAAGNARWRRMSASGWSEAWALEVRAMRWFVKVMRARFRSMANAETDGLAALAATASVRVPGVRLRLAWSDVAVVAFEWLEMRPLKDAAALGRAVAALHRQPIARGPDPGKFGWMHDNWIGGTPQKNAWSNDWAKFFRDRRLAPQFARAVRDGRGAALSRMADRVLGAVPALLRGHDPTPSLLHGDLWSGNVAELASGEPAIFDPAVYVGDREADIAMTELFGGFDAAFYGAYDEALPRAPGYEVRRELYNLYHLLNHLNLFGAGYRARVDATVARLLAEVG